MWSRLRTEYKIIAIIGIIFLVVLVIYLIKTDTVEEIKINYQKDKLINCTSTEYQKQLYYTEYYCNVGDNKNNTITITYPQFKNTDGDFKYINETLKNKYEESYNSIKYTGNSNNLELYSYISTNYKIYTNNNIMSIVIETEDIITGYKNKVNSYTIFNIDLTNNKIIKNDEFKEKYNIDRVYSTKLRSKIIEWYAVNFKYDYNNELPAYRNTAIDNSIESITYSSLSNFYIDDYGVINFIMNLYTPSYGSSRPYLFTYKKQDTTFTIIN